MMTMDDVFDQKLRDAFASANAQIGDSKAFVERLVRRLGREGRQRWMILGSAASLGSLIAASQLERVAETFAVETGIMAQVFAVMPPEAMTSIVLASIMAAFGMVLPLNSR